MVLVGKMPKESPIFVFFDPWGGSLDPPQNLYMATANPPKFGTFWVFGVKFDPPGGVFDPPEGG